MSKRLLAAASALLILGILSLVYLPYYVQQKVASSVAELEGQLQCLDWSVKGLNRIAINELCLEFHDVTLLVRDAELVLSLGQLWSSSSKLAVLSQAQIQRLDISVPANKFLKHTTDKKQAPEPTVAQTLAVLADIPFVQLPELSIAQITLKVSSSPEEQTAKLVENPLLSWSLNNKSSASENRLTISSLLDKQQWLKLTQNKQSKYKLAWQLSLADLYAEVNRLASAEQKVRLKPLHAVSGMWLGQLDVDGKNPAQLVSSHSITNLKTQLLLSEISTKAISVTGDLDFEAAFNVMEGKQQWRVSNISQSPLSITGISELTSLYLQQALLSGWQLQNPLSETVSLQLPVALILSDDLEIRNEGPLLVKSAEQQLKLDGIVVNLIEGILAARHTTDVALQLQQNRPDSMQTVAVSGEISGELQYQAATLNLNNLAWQFSSDELFRLLPAGSNADFADTLVAGQSNASFSTDEWQITGDYRARIEQPKLAFSSQLQFKPESLALSGNYNLAVDKVQMNNTITLREQVNASLKVSGEPSSLHFDTQLESTGLASLYSLVHGLPETLKVAQGTMSAGATGKFEQGQIGPIQVEVALSDASGAWQNYALSDLNTEFKGEIQSDGRIISTSNAIQIGNFFAGVDVSDINFEYGIKSTSDDQLQLNLLISNFKANLLSGQIKVQQPFYPMAGQGQLNLLVERLSVAELVELFNQQGLHVTGALSGKIPVLFSEGSVSVPHANLNAMQPGVIRISDNPAFMSLKSSQKNLASTLSLLENLQYSKLDTTMSLQPNGWLELAVKMQGMNVEKQQPINFNPTFSTNLYTGLKALRAGKDISKAIEQRF
ncbi:intermembrane phospholipid transport protein YdbH family protein [Planctobacterium marinum]|uniref:Dicarboxylate transport domain-containing protein n=1 Tax=Planctobacterium marinum TaxID=1631968 RepID=A0AA48HNQ3_9ALTE|nr:hypothetical protein MACH26_36770 [Planctobacterium marinum]